MIEPFSRLYITGHWDLENLALFNQAAYSNVEARDKNLDEAVKALKGGKQPNLNADEEEIDAFERAQSQHRTAIMAGDSELKAIARYADELTIVASWAFAEKYLNRGLAELRTVMALPAANSHRWPALKVAFNECGVDLGSLDSYSDADECRRVNNAIKHDGEVDTALRQFGFFAGKFGAALDDIELETQRYYFGVADFIGAMLERCSEVVQNLPAIEALNTSQTGP